VPDDRTQKRVDQIIAAHDAHEAALQAIRDEIGIEAAEAVKDEIHEQMSATVDQILRSTPPHLKT